MGAPHLEKGIAWHFFKVNLSIYSNKAHIFCRGDTTVATKQAQAALLTILLLIDDSVLQVETPLTVIAVCQDGDPGSWEVGAHLASHGHAEADIERLFLFIQWVVNDDDATEFLSLILVKTQHTGVVLRSGDVIRVGQHSAGYGASGRGWGIMGRKRTGD